MAGPRPGYGGGGGAVPWLPMFSTVALGDFATLDNYITAVTDHGGGEMTLTLDKTMQRTAVGNGDLLYLDLGQHIKAAGSGTHVLEARITTITRPANVAGSPFVAFCHNVGVNSRTATGPVLSLFYGATDSARLTTLLSSVTSTASGLGTVASWLLRYAHATAVGVNQYGVTADAIGGTAASARWSIMSTVTPPDAANIEVGYNQAGGQSHALAFSQLVSQPAGSDTLRIRCEYRVVPFNCAE